MEKVKGVCFFCDKSAIVGFQQPIGEILFLCRDCLKFMQISILEKAEHGPKLILTEPETFRKKPACSMLFLLAYYKHFKIQNKIILH